jgi:hypothetical protein
MKTLNFLTEMEQREVAAIADQITAELMPWLRQRVEREVIKNGKGFVIIQAGEILNEPEFMEVEREARYRKGFMHGYSRALDDILQVGGKQNKVWMKCAKFFDTALQGWCYRNTSYLPPDMNQREGGE